MKKQVLVIIFSLFLATPISAFANPVDPGWYISGGVGASKPTTSSIFSKSKKNNSTKISFSMSPVFNFNGGYRINKYCRIDISGQYRSIRMSGDYKPVKIKNFTAIANAYLDWTNYSPLTPYLTAGAGVGSLNVKNKKDPNFKGGNFIKMALNVGAGLRFQLNYNSGLDLGYRYIDLGKLKSGINKTLGAHEISLNLFILL